MNGGTPTSDPKNWDGDVPWATPADLAPLHGGRIATTARTLTTAGLRSGSTLVPAGSLLLSTRAPIGYVAEASVPMAFNQGCRALVPSAEIDIRYFRYQLLALGQELTARGQGTTFSELSTDSLATTPVHAPLLAYQRKVADFLDGETARIDALIEKKTQMIELLDLRAIRAAFDVITGKFDSDQRKSSGIPWLGDVPVAWDVAPLGSRYRVQLGRMLNAERATSGDLRPYLRNINVRWDDFDLTDVAEMDFPPEERRRYALGPGDLLVCEGGAGVGRAAVWNGSLGECYFQKSLHRVRSTGPWPVEWVMEWLRVSKWLSAFIVEGNLATIPHLTAEQLRAHRIPFPEPNRARALVRELRERRSGLEVTKSKIAGQIDLLVEHRQALITAAVTGELDLAEAA
jgi:type I restriction enzyme S subunit